jgi:hypothetical protein
VDVNLEAGILQADPWQSAHLRAVAIVECEEGAFSRPERTLKSRRNSRM